MSWCDLSFMPPLSFWAVSPLFWCWNIVQTIGLEALSSNGSGGAGFDIGLMYFTDPRFCFGGCKLCWVRKA